MIYASMVVSIVSLLISILSFGVAAFTFFIIYVRQKISVVGYFLHGFDEDKKFGDFEIECSLSNTGNTQLLFREVRFDFDYGVVPVIECNDLPKVVEPRQIVLIKFRIPTNFLKQLSNRDESISIDFDVISSNGEQFLLEKEITPLKRGGLADDWIDAFAYDNKLTLPFREWV